jgi:hypothetical protein
MPNSVETATVTEAVPHMTTGARRTSSHEQELDWAFCDTDSIAIANTRKLSHDEFKAKALLVRDWFKNLNPFGDDHSIPQLEDMNFLLRKAGDLEALDPPRCLAVSREALCPIQLGQRLARHPQGVRPWPGPFVGAL